MSTILPGNQESAALALDGGSYGLLARRQTMVKVGPEIIAEYDGTLITGTNIKIHDAANKILQKVYDEGYSSSPLFLLKKEAMEYPAQQLSFGTDYGSAVLVGLGDLSFLQWFVNVTRINETNNSSFPTGTSFIILPPNITTLEDFDLNYMNGGTVVFTGLTPPTKVSQYWLGYGDQYANIYVPDASYSAYQTKFKTLLNFSKSTVLLRHSDLSADKREKIKVMRY